MLVVRYIQAKEAQLVACNSLAQRLEENTIKLTTARYKARDMNRKLSSCSDQLETTKQSLQVTEKKLNDANKVLSETGCTMDRSGRLVERASDEENRCSRRLTETEASLKTERSALKNCSSHLMQERDDKIVAAATAEQCSMQTKWMQQRLDEYLAVFTRRVAETEEPPRLNKRGCSCDRRSTESKDVIEDFHKAEGGRDRTTETVVAAATADSANKDCGNCTRQLAEARANLKARETALKNCSSHLTKERRDGRTAAASAEECSGELSQSQYRLELKTSILTQCENKLKVSHDDLTTLSGSLERCTKDSKDLKSRLKVEEGGFKECGCKNEPKSTKCKCDPAELRQCNEKLATALDTVHWKTKQMNTCGENLARSRGEVQTLAVRLQQTEFDAENLKLRHREHLEDIQLRHEQELKQTTCDCSLVELMWIPVAIFVVIPMGLFLYAMSIAILYKPALSGWRSQSDRPKRHWRHARMAWRIRRPASLPGPKMNPYFYR